MYEGVIPGARKRVELKGLKRQKGDGNSFGVTDSIFDRPRFFAFQPLSSFFTPPALLKSSSSFAIHPFHINSWDFRCEYRFRA